MNILLFIQASKISVVIFQIYQATESMISLGAGIGQHSKLMLLCSFSNFSLFPHAQPNSNICFVSGKQDGDEDFPVLQHSMIHECGYYSLGSTCFSFLVLIFCVSSIAII